MEKFHETRPFPYVRKRMEINTSQSLKLHIPSAETRFLYQQNIYTLHISILKFTQTYESWICNAAFLTSQKEWNYGMMLKPGNSDTYL